MNSSLILNPEKELDRIYFREAVDFFKPSVKPIYTRNNQKILAFIGSGILLNINGKKYLVTAGHVIDECVGNEVFIPSGDKLHKISVNGFSTLSPDEDRSKDVFDYACCVLSKNEVKNLGESKFIDEAYVSYKPNKYCFAAIGYPKSKNNFKPSLGRAEGGFYAYSSNKIQQKDFYYYLEHEKTSLNDKGKKFDNPISLYGMSGGAILDLGIYNWHEIIDKSVKKTTAAKIIGLIIEKNKNERECEEIKAISLQMIVRSIKVKQSD